MEVQDRSSTEASKGKVALEQIPGGRYHIVERLSMGAIGAVYKALDTILDRPVAVKSVRLDSPFADHTPDELRERFVREARIAARLQHPNIVTTHDIVATDTRGFIIMEFIEGESLESLLKAAGRLELSKAIRVLGQLASALDYAHGRNVVHRDVKPSNIIVSPEANVWVTDFGIAKSELSTNLTMAGGVLGTPDYMSPEQAKGEDVDARSDLFSLGCVLFECVTGEKPFRNPSLTGVLLSIINDEPAFPLNWDALGLPARLKPILHHALEKDREKRHPTCAALVEALSGLDAEEVAAADACARRGEEGAEPDAKGSVAEAEARDAPPTDEPTREASPEEPQDGSKTLIDAPVPDLSQADETAEPAAEASESVEASEPPETHEAPEAAPADEEAEEATIEVEAPDNEAVEREEAGAAESEMEPAPAKEPEPLEPERLASLKSDGRPLKLAPALSSVLHGLAISPEEGFILSRVDGLSRASEILALSPMQEDESARALFRLLDKGLIQFTGTPVDMRKAAPEHVVTVETRPAPKGPDAEMVAEIDRLLSLADERAWTELLGVERDASEKARKGAYLKIIGKFHPDKFSWAKENGFQAKLSRLCAAASEAVDELAAAGESEGSSSGTAAAASDGNGSGAAAPVRSPGESTGAFDRSKYARELHDRAQRAFDLQDFWDAIQLSRQAIEADEAQADFHFLLGCALMQNKRWRKEAADAFRRASEIEPMNVGYLGMLGAIYRAEGLSTRADSVLKRAREIDPEYELPDIESDVEPSVETT